MKKYIIQFIAVITCVVGMTSCVDYLDKEPDDFLTIDKVFNDKAHVEQWLSAIYSGVKENYRSAARGVDSFADDIAPSIGWEAYGWPAISKQKGSFDSTSDWEYNGDYMYTAPRRIRSGYIFLERVKALPGQGLTEQEVTYMKAEVKFLIGYLNYVRLITYGAVPVQEGIVDLEAGDDEMLIGQTPFDEVVDKIDKWLMEAAETLPPNYQDFMKYGRATSIMCYAVRARMLLFAASPLVNGNKDYANYRNNKGELIFNQTLDPRKWNRAADACKDLIELAEANGHALYKEYNADGSIDPFLSYQNMLFTTYNNGNKEILFARAWVNSEEYDRLSQPRGAGGNGGLGVTQTLVDAFFMSNGLSPIQGYRQDGSPVLNTASGYTETGFSTGDAVAKTRWIEGASGASKNNEYNVITRGGTYNMYCNREPRFYVSVLYNNAWYRASDRNTEFYKGWQDGGPTHDSPSYGYLLRKKVHPDVNIINNFFPYRPGIMYRLGEAYLNYAEALNECDPGNPDILVYLNRIRERAGIPQYGSNPGEIAAPEDQIDMREAIRKERRVELCCENGLRWDDVRRWKIGEDALDGDFYGMNANGTKSSYDPNDADAYFVRSYVMTRSFKKRDYWMPIPQSEMDKNVNLRQLPGW